MPRDRETLMAKSRKVIITCAVTGAIHTPSMSPHLPITASEIADAAIGAAEAGAAIVHLHARNPNDGRPDQSPEAFAPFLKVIKQRSNCVINITTGGAPTMSVEERVRPAATFKPEVASLNMGTMNFGLFPDARAPEGIQVRLGEALSGRLARAHLQEHLRRHRVHPATCADNGTRFEIECYDIGHLYTLRHFADRGLVKPPFFVQSVFGILGGIGPHPEDVAHMKRTADRLFGDEYRWSCSAPGGTRWPIAAMSAAMGGNVRVGPRGLALDRPGPARQDQRRAGPRCARSSRAWGSRSRPGRGARDALPQGRRQGGVLEV